MSCRSPSPAPAPPLEDEDLLQEILLRLPPKPSSLPRASLVCKLWRNILSDPQFLKRFRKHHQRPPLLGFFSRPIGGIPISTPVLDPPDHIHFVRFSVPWSYYNTDQSWKFIDSRHGLAVLINKSRREIVVWDPLTGQHHLVNFPSGLNGRLSFWHAAVLCADAEDGHVHGDCFSSPFKLVLLCDAYMSASACLYESTSGLWGNVISTATTKTICSTRHNVLVGDALYWLFSGGEVLAFDLERQSLGVIEKPYDAHIINNYYGSLKLLRTQNSRLGLAHLSEQTIQFWERRSNCHGAARWVLLQKTIPLEGMLPWGMDSDDKTVHFVGYDEETNVIVLSTMFGNFTLQLDSMQIRHISKRKEICDEIFYPYRNIYTAGRGVGWKWLDLEL